MTKKAALIETFKKTFNQLNKNNLHLLDSIYAEDFKFKDPIHEIQGLLDYKKYLNRLYDKVQYCHFDFHRTFVESQEAMIIWTMHLEHPRLNGGKRYASEGVSWVKFKEKITYHQDFFDVSEFLLERIPLLGKIPKWIKSAV